MKVAYLEELPLLLRFLLTDDFDLLLSALRRAGDLERLPNGDQERLPPDRDRLLLCSGERRLGGDLMGDLQTNRERKMRWYASACNDEDRGRDLPSTTETGRRAAPPHISGWGVPSSWAVPIARLLPVRQSDLSDRSSVRVIVIVESLLLIIG